MKQYNPFLSAGISKNYLISQKTSRHQELEYYDYVERRFYEFDDRLDKKNWSMWGSLGPSTKLTSKLNGYIELKFETTKRLDSDFTHLQFLHNSTHVVLGIKY
jgi:hypothetical protein